jgi:hypothetical protein
MLLKFLKVRAAEPMKNTDTTEVGATCDFAAGTFFPLK